MKLLSKKIVSAALLLSAGIAATSAAQAAPSAGGYSKWSRSNQTSYNGKKSSSYSHHKLKSSYGSRYSKGSHGNFNGYKKKHYGPSKVWIPGAYELRHHKVWVAGYKDKIWCPPVFETRYDICGIAFKVEISAGYYRTVQHPGYYESKSQRVWVPAHWRYTG